MPSSAGLPANPDRSHNFLRPAPHGLDAFFHPRRVAVAGATDREGSTGRAVFRNLLANTGGIEIVPVNPARPEVGGVRAYPDLNGIPGPVDLAVIVTPAVSVPDLIGQCAECGISAALILSAGFREIGAVGEALERRALEKARGRVRLIGPNCLGFMSPTLGLNATFAGPMAKPGNLAFLSQSGALCSAILDWSHKVGIGFSGFVSTGSMLDVDFGDLLDYFGDDPATKAILLYMETVGDARSFLSAAREMALSKPIIAIKAGRSREAVQAVSSHTGTLAGSDAVLDAAFRRAGVQRVETIEELFYLAEALGKQPRPKGPSLAVVTNAGGPGVLSVDALMASGGRLAPLSEKTLTALNAILPPHWSHANPVDVIGDADPGRFAGAVRAVLEDPGCDGILAVLTPQNMTDPAATAEQMAALPRGGKPLLASWMGGGGMQAGIEVLNRAGIPAMPFPDAAARIFSYMAAHESDLRDLYETPLPWEESDASGRGEAARILDAAAEKGRTTLTEWESKRLLAAYGIPVVETSVAATEEDALYRAQAIGYPVVVKLHSETLTHKTDVDGVRLNLGDAGAVAEAFRGIRAAVAEKAGAEHFQGVSVQPMVRERGLELILGGHTDSQFGPVVLFGWGGVLVETLGDTALGLPPLNSNLAFQLMRRTRVFKALQGTRGRPPADLQALAKILVRFSRILPEHPRIKEIDINPLLASDSRLLALDARVILHAPGSAPPPPPAIRPYPAQYMGEAALRDGRSLKLRPIRPEDEPLMARFHGRLSEQTVYQRYFETLRLDRRVAHDRLVRVCFNDYDRALALVALYREEGNGTEEIAAVARLTRSRGGRSAELSALVEDRFQGQGLGKEMARRLLRFAEDEGLEKVVAYILPTNQAMQNLCKGLGFKLRFEEDRATAEWRPGGNGASRPGRYPGGNM